VRRVESAGKQRAAIVHTATGRHREELYSLFADVLEPEEPGDSEQEP
jgi:hypothetical protein